MKKKEILKILLVVLIAIFLLIGIAGILLIGHRKNVRKQAMKEQAIAALENIPKVTPTPAVTATPTPTPIPTVTPTPAITRAPAFNPDDYWNEWYSTDGLACINIYDISEKSVSFYFSQGNKDGSAVSEADVIADIAGNAAKISFKDSHGSRARGYMTFDQGQLYVNIATRKQAEGVSVSPSVKCLMTREKKQIETPVPTATPVPEQTKAVENTAGKGDYYFADSDSRYLTDEELSKYSSKDLELAKNEIYARHGRKFVTESIAAYFNSKSWYKGTIDPETFDASQNSVFNEYEVANIEKIAQWEQKQREQGK